MAEMNGEMAEGRAPLLSATIAHRYLPGDAGVIGCRSFVYHHAENVIRSPSRRRFSLLGWAILRFDSLRAFESTRIHCSHLHPLPLLPHIVRDGCFLCNNNPQSFTPHHPILSHLY